MTDLKLPQLTVDPSNPYPDARDFVSEAAETAASVSDALGTTYQSVTGGGSFQFPSDLGSRKVVFKVKPRNRPTTTTQTRTGPSTIIGLPIPANLSTGYGAQYSQTGLGVLGSEAQALAGTVTDVSSAIDTLKDRGGNIGLEAAKSIAASASPEIAAILGGAILGTTGLGVGAALGQGARGALSGANIAVNPHLAVLFEGVSFREHSFQYKFAPRNSGESSSVKNIIKTFKKAMLPSIDEGKLAFFNYPDEFDIEFPNDNGFLFKIGTSVLTGFQINYTPDGGSYFHQNGAPVSVSLALSFTEIDILTKKEIDGGK